MIGSAFAVVVPEGFETLYSAARAHHTRDHHEALLQVDDWHEDEDTQESVQENGHGEPELPVPRWSPGAMLLTGFLCMMIFEYLHHCFAGDSDGHSHSLSHSHGGAFVRVRARRAAAVVICLMPSHPSLLSLSTPHEWCRWPRQA